MWRWLERSPRLATRQVRDVRDGRADGGRAVGALPNVPRESPVGGHGASRTEPRYRLDTRRPSPVLIGRAATRQECPVCGKKVGNFAVHLRNDHGPPGRGEIEAENRKQIALYSFALVRAARPPPQRELQ